MKLLGCHGSFSTGIFWTKERNVYWSRYCWWTNILHHFGWKQKKHLCSTLSKFRKFPSPFHPIWHIQSALHSTCALRENSRARPNPLERCYDWCCVVKRLFRKSDAGSAKRSTLHDSSQSLFLTLLLLIQSQDRYGPNGNPRFTIKILRGNTIFQFVL